MTPDQAIRFVTRLTYKPKYRFRASVLDDFMGRHADDCVEFTLMGDAPDAQGSVAVAEITSRTTIPTRALTDMDEAQLAAAMYELALSLERHELEEWLRIDGKHFREPHPEMRLARGWAPQLEGDLTVRLTAEMPQEGFDASLERDRWRWWTSRRSSDQGLG